MSEILKDGCPDCDGIFELPGNTLDDVESDWDILGVKLRCTNCGQWRLVEFEESEDSYWFYLQECSPEQITDRILKR